MTILTIIAALGAGLGLQGPMSWFILGLVIGVYLVLLILGVFILKLNYFVNAHCRGEADAKQVALTFDDGPDPDATPNLLRILKHHGITATFFPIGTKMMDYPEITMQIDLEGHAIGNHSFRHAWWTNFLIGGALDREIKMVQEAVEDITGKVPAYFRPPMGLTNPHLGRALKKQKLTVIGWDVRPFDIGLDARKVIKRVLEKIRNGSIILLHDKGRSPADLSRLADELIIEIKKRGYEFKTIQDLFNEKPYQTATEVNLGETAIAVPFWPASAEKPWQGGFLRFLAQRLASTHYVRKAIQEKVTLEAFKTRPSFRFLVGVGLVLFSYVLGWPMVGLFSFLSAYLQKPALLMVGPAFYGFSHLLFLFGMVLSGRDCIKYADNALSWFLSRAVEKGLN